MDLSREYLNAYKPAGLSGQSAIHPTAIIEKGAELGKGVKIGAHSIVGRQVRIGDEVTIGPHVVIDGKTKIGDRTRIWPFSSIGSMSQDLKFYGEDSELTIGTDNAIREGVNISIGTGGGGGKTIIGNFNLLMVYSHVAHDCNIGNNVVIGNSVALAGHITIQDDVHVAGLTGVHQFVRIGKLSMVAGGSMVAQDVPPYCMVQGDRAKISGLNLVGMKRAGITGDHFNNIKQIYRLIYRENHTLEEALVKIEQEIPDSDPGKKIFLDFLRLCERGVCR